METGLLVGCAGIIAIALFYALVIQPLWAHVDNLKADRSPASKILFLIAMLIGWGFITWAYALFLTQSEKLRAYGTAALGSILIAAAGFGYLIPEAYNLFAAEIEQVQLEVFNSSRPQSEREALTSTLSELAVETRALTRPLFARAVVNYQLANYLKRRIESQTLDAEYVTQWQELSAKRHELHPADLQDSVSLWSVMKQLGQLATGS